MKQLLATAVLVAALSTGSSAQARTLADLHQQLSSELQVLRSRIETSTGSSSEVWLRLSLEAESVVKRARDPALRPLRCLALVKQATCLRLAGELEGCEARLREAEKLADRVEHPATRPAILVEVYVDRALLCRARNDRNGAVAAFRDSLVARIELAETQLDARTFSGLLQGEQDLSGELIYCGRHEEALPHVQSGLRHLDRLEHRFAGNPDLDPESWRSLFLSRLVEIHLLADRGPEALQACGRALIATPGDGNLESRRDLLLTAARLTSELGQPAAALPIWAEAERISRALPLDEARRIALVRDHAKTLDVLGRDEEALAMRSALLLDWPDDSEPASVDRAHIALDIARAQLRRGMAQQALDELESSAPDLPDTLATEHALLTAEALLALGRSEEARDRFSELAGVDDTASSEVRVRARDGLARSLLMLGDVDAARGSLERACAGLAGLELGPEVSLPIRSRLAALLLRTDNDPAGSITLLETLVGDLEEQRRRARTPPSQRSSAPRPTRASCTSPLTTWSTPVQERCSRNSC